MPEEKRTGRLTGFFDVQLLFITILLIGFGLVMVYSASSYSAALGKEGDSFLFLKRQLISVGVGTFTMIFATIIPYKFYSKICTPIYFAGIVFIVLLFFVGGEANGATRWLRIGSFSVQPSEICKLCTIVLVSTLVSKMGGKIRKSFKGYVFVMAPVLLYCLMILFISRNLSSAIIVGLIAVLMYMIAEKKNKWPAITLGAMFAVCAFITFLAANGWLPKKIGFRLERVMAWLDPYAYSDGRGMQIIQSLYGIGSGGIKGKGLGMSMQKLGWLPEANNDMIFAIICEELGIVGALAVLLMFAYMFYRIIDIANHTKDYLATLIVTGIFCHISLQVILNICVVTNLIPNTGVPLPFISYGGTSIIILMTEIGILLNIGMHASLVEEETSVEQESTETN
ncbi:MAG: putative lipid II flippase FtsW [Lachnospiraceae bacterium]|nr:putative lipid II flippase FtsW [Lachnospiraceae bacterium]